MPIRSWKYRLYPSKAEEKAFEQHLRSCQELWNSLLESVKRHHEETGKFLLRKELYLLTTECPIYSQVAQNVADRLFKSICGMISRKKAGKKAGFPRFKPIERIKSFTFPQFGFKLTRHLELSGIGRIAIKRHRPLDGKIKTLTIKRSASGKWFAIFTSMVEEKVVQKRTGLKVGLDLGIETFAYLSDGQKIENPRNLDVAEERLKLAQRRMSRKKKGSFNRAKARHAVAVAYEKLADKRRDFLHKASRILVNNYALIALEDLDNEGLAKGFLAKEVLDCSWAEFARMLAYKAEEAGCEVVLVDPANTTSGCSGCGLIQKKSLAERWHRCRCGAAMPRDLNAAINILTRATSGIGGRQACGEEIPTGYYCCQQISSLKQEAKGFSPW